MALDTLTAKANTGAGTDQLAGHNTAAGFAAAGVLITPDGQDLSKLSALARTRRPMAHGTWLR